MLETLSYTISDISMYSISLPLLVGLLKLRQHNIIQQYLFGVVLISVVVEIIAYWGREVNSLQSIVFYLFSLIEFSLLLLLYKKALVPFVKAIQFHITGILFFTFLIIDMVGLSGLNQFNTYSTALESLLLISFALIFFYKTLKELQIENLERAPIFWINVAVLLYFSSSLFIFLFTNYIKSSLDALYILWGMHGIFNILHNIFYSIALWLKPKT